VLTDRD